MSSSQFDFKSWGLETSIVDGISSFGWETPTEIQREAIPSARKGFDIVGQAKTGSGKTGAFGICKVRRAYQSKLSTAVLIWRSRQRF